MSTEKQFTVADNLIVMVAQAKKKERLIELKFLNRKTDWPIVADVIGISIKKAKEALIDEYSIFHKLVVDVLDFVINTRINHTQSKTTW